MSLLVDIAEVSLGLFFAAMLAIQFAALWAGASLGQWRHRAGGAEAGDQAERIGVVVGSLLGLLAFTLGLMISIAEARFEERRRSALDEANAIGTAWLRAHALGHPRGDEIARLLEDYTRIRLDWVQARHDSAALETATAATNQAQGVIWGHAAAIARERNDPVLQGVLAALNQTFDLASTQRWAFRGQVPAELPWLLLCLTVAGVAGIGYQWGLRERWHPVVATLLMGAWSGCLVMIVDLANPRIGWVRVDASPFHWTLQGFQGGLRLPPAP